MKLDIYSVAGLLHYAPLYLAITSLQEAELPYDLEIRFIQLGNDEAAIREVVRGQANDTIPILLTSTTDLAAREPAAQEAFEHFVLWFTLVQRPFFALCCAQDRFHELHKNLGIKSTPVRLACYPKGSTIRHLIDEFFRSHISSGSIVMEDIEFPTDGYTAIERGDADLAVTIQPWTFEGPSDDAKSGRLFCGIPSRPFGFTCGLSHRRYFERGETRQILEELSTRVSEEVYSLYSSFDEPFWAAQESLVWSPTVREFEAGSRITGAVFSQKLERIGFFEKVKGKQELVAVDSPRFPDEEAKRALTWMAASQIWAFDSLDIPRLEKESPAGGPRLGSEIPTAKSLSADERAGETEALRIYGEVKPLLDQLGKKQSTIQEIVNDLERIQIHLGRMRWNLGRRELSSLAHVLDRCFDVLHTPEDLDRDEFPRLVRTIVEHIQESAFLSSFAAFRDTCSKSPDPLPAAVVKNLFNPLFGLGMVGQQEPRRHELELVYFAKALSIHTVPGYWIGLSLAHHSNPTVAAEIEWWRYFVNPGSSRQVQFLRALNSLLSEVRLEDPIVSQDTISIETFIQPGSEGMKGLEYLEKSINAIQDISFEKWLEKNKEDRAGKTLNAIGALAPLPITLETTLVDREGLQLRLDLKVERRPPPRYLEIEIAPSTN